MLFAANNYAFIDAQNLNLGVRSMGWKIDWRKFRTYLAHKYRVQKAFLFVGYLPEQQRLYSALQQAGFILVFKTVLVTRDGKVKGNVDAELVLHAMIEYPNFARAIIVTSDGDFACLVEYLSEKGKLLKVVSPTHQHCSVLLRRVAKDRIAFLQDLHSKLSYEQQGIVEGQDHIRNTPSS
ncbi:MAG: NYN domain-containing protein [Candidatus Peribacteraceae bacterium]|nr:NYN domain-containing protein [Candidatus Peribacteraceae bacterium]